MQNVNTTIASSKSKNKAKLQALRIERTMSSNLMNPTYEKLAISSMIIYARGYRVREHNNSRPIQKTTST